MTEQFHLKAGEERIIEKDSLKYKLSCSIFKDHDHDNKPLYYYYDEIDEDDVVATVEGNDGPPYQSPYSCEVKTMWGVMRKNIAIKFTKKGQGLLVEIFDRPDDSGGPLSLKGKPCEMFWNF